ncbi:hypothetical protein GCM10027447_14260 [Glycomyces halotolerans]
MSPIAIDDERLFRFVVKVQTEEAASFRGSGFLAAPGFALTCAHVVAGLPDGATVRLARTGDFDDLRGVIRARTPDSPGSDGLWAWPDLAIIELVDQYGPFTDHPSPRLDLASPPPSEPSRRRAVVAVRPDPTNPASAPRVRGVDFTWESVDDHGFWWLTGGHALRGMSGGMLLDAERGAIVGVVNNSRGASGAVATPLSALADPSPPQAFTEAAHRLTAAGHASIDWDGAFTRRLGFEWRDYWAPDSSGAHFVGREAELEKLQANLDESSGLAVVQSIGGFGGVGKTALAVAFGNRFRNRFPGGRVFHDFHSYRGSRSDTAADALGSVLKAVGAATTDELARLGHRERADLWQSVAAGRRLLMVWDNVDGLEQLDGLIVRGDGCATIVTSRDIVRVEPNVRPLRLDVLEEADAIAMFTAIAGDHHPGGLVAELVRRDLYVPVLISTHAEEVAGEEIALEEIIDDLPDPATARRASHPDHQKDLFDRLEGSYLRLDPEARYAFRALGAHPGYSATAGSLAAIMGCELTEAERRMRRLVKTGLAERDLADGGRRDRRLRAYKAHDLIRAYGAHLAELESGDELDRSRRTLIDHFQEQLTGSTFTNQKDWFGIEADSIRDLALSGTSDAHARLARYTGYRALVFNRYDSADVAFQHALALAERTGDIQRVAHMRWGLGEVARLTGELDTAEDRYRSALEASRTADDLGGIGNAERGLGEIAQLQGRADDAEAHYSTAMDAYLSIPDPRRAAYTQRGLARVAELGGDFALAEERFNAALETSRGQDDQVGVAYAQRGVADVVLAAGEADRAGEHYRAAQATFEAIGHPVGVATTWHGLGNVASARGDLDEARTLFERAAEVYRSHDEALWSERVTADLARLDGAC